MLSQVEMVQRVLFILIVILAIVFIYNYTKHQSQGCASCGPVREGFEVPEEQVGLNAPHDIKLEIARNSQLPVKRGDGGYGAINGEATSILSFNRDVSNIPPNYGPNYPPTLATDYATDPQVDDPTNTVQGAILKNFRGSYTNTQPYEYTPFQKKYPDDCNSEYWF